MSYIGRASCDEALAAFQKQVEIKPDHLEAWNNMGLVFKQQGNLDKAAAAFANGLKVQPYNLYLLSNDAELALIQGDIPRLSNPHNHSYAITKI